MIIIRFRVIYTVPKQKGRLALICRRPCRSRRVVPVCTEREDNMELYFNVTGERRKDLVQAIGEIINAVPVYKKTFQRLYGIGDLLVDKDGVLYYDEQTATSITSLVAALAERGFTCKAESVLTIEMPLSGFTEATFGNLERLVASKAALIKKVIGAEVLPIERTEDTLRFPWFSSEASPAEVRAYSVFIERLCTTANTQKRVTAVERPVENEKYAFRCFLLKLGFIGDEYKSARKVLLAKREGDSAWKVKGIDIEFAPFRSFII